MSLAKPGPLTFLRPLFLLLPVAALACVGCNPSGTQSLTDNDNSQTAENNNENGDSGESNSNDNSQTDTGNNENNNGNTDPGGNDNDSTGDANTNMNDNAGGDDTTGSKFGSFRLDTSATAKIRAKLGNGVNLQAIGDVPVTGVIVGVDSETAKLAFLDQEGGEQVVDVDPSGSFDVMLAENVDYHIALLDDGHFEMPVIGDPHLLPPPDEQEDPTLMILQYVGPTLEVVGGPVQTSGAPLMVNEDGVPIGLDDGVELPGLTEAADEVVAESDLLDADRDGIPSRFDPDKDGDGMIDIADDDVPAIMPVVDTSGTDGETVSGAFVFNNLKLDLDQLIPPPTSLFAHNDAAVVTIGWLEEPAETPAGYAVSDVRVVDLPGWHRFGFVTAVSDWTIAPGVNGYVGYPASGTAWSADLYRESPTSRLWQVWVQAPEADAALAATYPSYVEAGKSVPLNWDLAGLGTPTSNKIDYYRLEIVYSNGTGTFRRYATAGSLFSFRTPGVSLSITTSTGAHAIDPNDVNGVGHAANPIAWDDVTAKGDVMVEAMPPKYDVTSAGGLITGTMNWRFDVFYYNAAGEQIGGYLTPEVPVTYTGGTIMLTIPEAALDHAGGRTDMNGDGVADFTGAFTSDDIAAYKIDLTAVAITGGDNTGLFFYFVADSRSAGFAGF